MYRCYYCNKPTSNRAKIYKTIISSICDECLEKKGLKINPENLSVAPFRQDNG